MIIKGFICCPRCGRKTKTKVNSNTRVYNFPLWCGWCRNETMVNVDKFKVLCCEKG